MLVRMKRWLWRTVVWVGVVVGVAAVALVVARHWAGPAVVRSVVKGQLAGLGIHDAKFDVVDVSATRVVIVDLASADRTLTASRVEAWYSPAGVASGEIRRLIVDGLRTGLRVNDDGSVTVEGVALAGGSGEDWRATVRTLPDLTLSRSALHVRHGDQRHQFTCDAALTTSAQGRAATLTVRGDGLTIAADATLGLDGVATITLDTSARLLPLLHVARGSAGPPPWVDGAVNAVIHSTVSSDDVMRWSTEGRVEQLVGVVAVSGLAGELDGGVVKWSAGGVGMMVDEAVARLERARVETAVGAFDLGGVVSLIGNEMIEAEVRVEELRSQGQEATAAAAPKAAPTAAPSVINAAAPMQRAAALAPLRIAASARVPRALIATSFADGEMTARVVAQGRLPQAVAGMAPSVIPAIGSTGGVTIDVDAPLTLVGREGNWSIAGGQADGSPAQRVGFVAQDIRLKSGAAVDRLGVTLVAQPSAGGVDLLEGSELWAQGIALPGVETDERGLRLQAGLSGRLNVPMPALASASGAPPDAAAQAPSIDNLRVSLLAQADTIAAGGIQLTGVSGVLPLVISGNLSQARATFAGEAYAEADSLAGGGLSLGPTRLDLSATDGQPLAVYDGAALTLAGRLDTASPFMLTAQGASVSVGVVSLVAQGSPLDGTFSGRLMLGDVDIAAPQAELTLADLAIDAPLSSEQTADEGSIRCDQITFRDVKMPGFTGTIALQRGKLAAAVDWPVVEEGVIRSGGWVDTTGPVVTAGASVWVPRFTLDDPEALRRVLPAVGEISVSGTFTADSRFYYDGNQWIDWAWMKIEDGALASTQYDASLSGIAGEVTLRQVWPVETSGGQTVAVSAARMGRLNVSDGDVRFRVEREGTVFVEQALFGWAGGQMAARGFRVEPTTGQTSVVVNATNLQLKTVLSETAGDANASGEGLLVGQIPVRVAWPRVELTGAGYVYAEPGAAGVLRLGPDARATVSPTIEAALGGGAGGGAGGGDAIAQVRQRALGALRDFRFDVLRVTLRKQNGVSSAAVRVVGKGSPQSGGQPIDLTLNVSGIEEALNVWLSVGEAQDRLKTQFEGTTP